jgi:carbamoyltransferase
LGTARSVIPAVTHVDFSARVQTVAADVNPALHALLTAFASRTGCPVLVNTSFNVRGEPPVCHPREALEGFLATEMDCLALGPFFLEKRNQPANLIAAPTTRTFAPD